MAEYSFPYRPLTQEEDGPGAPHLSEAQRLHLTDVFLGDVRVHLPPATAYVHEGMKDGQRVLWVQTDNLSEETVRTTVEAAMRRSRLIGA